MLKVLLCVLVIGCGGGGGTPGGDDATDARGDGVDDTRGSDAMVPASCDPLADNDFDGAGPLTKARSFCAVGQGCFGAPQKTAPGTHWDCETDGATNMRHRAVPVDPVVLTSCNEGYVPIVHESWTAQAVVCVALCKPGNAYLGNPNAQVPAGASPHGCNTLDAVGTFNTTSNGDQCMYSWRYEVASGKIRHSATGDSVGLCVDHSQYKWDSNGNGSIDAGDDTWPACADLPLVASPGQLSAADLGCVDSSLSGLAAARVVTEIDHWQVDVRQLAAR